MQKFEVIAMTETNETLFEKIDDTLKISSLKYPIPKIANTYGYALGAMTLFSFVIMAVTGIILSQFYDPNPDLATSSVNYISSIWILQYVRGLHWWTASFIPLFLMLHMLRIVITGSYKGNRIVTWFVGVILAILSLLMLFTGTVLKYDQEGFEALEHFDLTNRLLGPLGAPLTSDFTSSTPLLTRVYSLHISLLPLVLLILIGAHMLYIKIHGVSPAPGEEDTWEEESDVTFLDHLKVVSVYSGILFVVLSLFAIVFPREQSPLPISGVEVTRPTWAFLPWYPIENWIGLWAIVIFPAIAVILLLSLPLIDRGKERDPRVGARKVAVGAFLFFVLFVVVFTIYSGLLVPADHFG